MCPVPKFNTAGFNQRAELLLPVGVGGDMDIVFMNLKSYARLQGLK